jgi:hypothetical protein
LKSSWKKERKKQTWQTWTLFLRFLLNTFCNSVLHKRALGY